MYLTYDGVIERFPILKEKIEEKKTISRKLVENWIRDAESLVDSYIGERYNLPFVEVPDYVLFLANEAFEYIYLSATNTPPYKGEEGNWLTSKWERLISMLEEVRDGLKLLFDKQGNTIAPSKRKVSSIRSNKENVDQIFTMKDFWEQTVDENYDKEP
ncbi:MAG TPA: DUF1320 family protein [bacterium]|nr:DUF1320 family protein [bacterium]